MTVPKFVFESTPPDPMLPYPAIRIPVEKPWRIEDHHYNKFYRQIESDLNNLLQKISNILQKYTLPSDKGLSRYIFLDQQYSFFQNKLKELQTHLAFTIQVDDVNIIWDWGRPNYNLVERAQYVKLSTRIIAFRRALNHEIENLNSNAYLSGLIDCYQRTLRILYERYYQMTNHILLKTTIQQKGQVQLIKEQPNGVEDLPKRVTEPVLLLNAAIQESLAILSLLRSRFIPSFLDYHAICNYFTSCEKANNDGTSFSSSDSFDYTFDLTQAFFAPRSVNYIPHIPTEPLPRVGDIYEHNGKRFLGISAEKIYDYRDKLISESKRLHMPIRIIPEEMELAMKTQIAEPYRAAIFLLDRMHPILHERTYRISHKSRASWLERADFEKQADELDTWQNIPYFKQRIDSFLTALTDCKIFDNNMGDRLHIASGLLNGWDMEDFHKDATNLIESHIGTIPNPL